ncbi:hypothetical protein OV203_27985 [Nannocystis sp. ILAH1]|uniref:hypothetical protein n=1 Tax=unclassified Nannocystis TaxID=2627009 RepID=UPI00226FBC27|nr:MULTISPECIES: hypothetical protein [unclassified Nannocystis]MCY0991017.1 hypothetical protein [Nannocystis sp. ILAH1]MCY1064522.1 hypothetical protein [Nannocystis sp. RBIL2]
MKTRIVLIITGLLGACGGQTGDMTTTDGTGTGTGASSESTGPTSTSSGSTDGSSSDATTAVPTTGSSSTTGEPGSSGSSSGEPDTSSGSTGADCLSCAESLMGAEGELCEASQMLSDALFACICDACADVCEATCTMAASPTAECSMCQNQAFADTCMQAVMACLADT